MYNMVQDGQTAVKLEIWVDLNNNNSWQKVYDHVDSDSRGDNGRRVRWRNGSIDNLGRTYCDIQMGQCKQCVHKRTSASERYNLHSSIPSILLPLSKFISKMT